MSAHAPEGSEVAHLARILLSLAVEAGGEIRLKGSTYDSLDSRRMLLIDFSAEKGELVIRAASQFSRAIVIEPENRQWTKPLEENPRVQRQTEAERLVQRSTVLDDEKLADLEDRKAKESAAARVARDSRVPSKFSVRSERPSQE